MRGLAASFLTRRIMSTRLLLGSVMLTVLITAAVTAALASFGAESLPRAVQRQLAHSPALTISVTGSGAATTTAADTRAVRASMRRALGEVPFQLEEARWSDPFGLPSPHGSRTVPITQAASFDRIQAHATLVAGAWPGPPTRGGPVGAALPATAAQRLGLAPGALLRLRDRITSQRIIVRITGVFQLRDPASPYWRLDLVATSGVSVQAPFVTYGPLVVSPAAFGGHGLAVGGGTWVVIPDGARISDSAVSGLAPKVARSVAFLQNAASLGGLQVSTGLPGLTAGLAQNMVVARSLLIMGLLQLLLLAAAALSLGARLLASHREEESALLAARGAARSQLVRPAAAEAVGLGIVAAAAGALLGSRMASLLTESRGLGGAGRAAWEPPTVAWVAALAVLALSTAILLWPALRPAESGAARVRRGRQAALAGIARTGGDISLAALAVIAVVELRAYSAVAQSPAGGLGIDPVPVVAPALALAGITLVPLRLLPAAAKAIDRLIAKTRHLGSAMASWEISRRPVSQSAPVLLVILAVGTGSLALSQYQSWRRSAQDRAAFDVGADVRVDTVTPLPLASSGRIAHAPGVTAAMPVASTVTGTGAQLLGLDVRHAAATVLLRPDLSPVPVSTLWRKITPTRPATGLALPGRPARLRITASLAAGGAGHLGAASVTAAIQDAVGIVYQIPAGTLPSDGRVHNLTAVLSPTRRASYPLRLLGLSVSYTLPAYAGPTLLRREVTRPAALAITGLAAALRVSGPYGAPFAAGSALASWRPGVSAPALSNLFFTSGPLPPGSSGSLPKVVGKQPGTARGQRLSFDPGEGPVPAVLFSSGIDESAVSGVLTLTAAAPTNTVPAIVTQAFRRSNHLRPGAVVPVSVGSTTILVKVVAAVSEFPTIGGGRAVIVDMAALQDALATRWQPPVPVTQWWLSTATGAVPRGLPPGALAADRARAAAALLGNPLSGVPQRAALAIAVVAVLLAVVGFSVSVAASMRARRTQSAVLAALGVARSGLAGQLCLEQLMLSVPAAAAGLVAGALLAHVLVPAVILTTTASRPVPPALVEFPLQWAVPLALAVAALPVVVAAVTVARRPDPAAELRAAMAA